MTSFQSMCLWDTVVLFANGSLVCSSDSGLYKSTLSCPVHWCCAWLFFYYTAGTISFLTNMTLNFFGIEMLTVRIAMFHMVYLDSLEGILSHNRYSSLFLNKVEIVWNGWKCTWESRSVDLSICHFKLTCNLLFPFL